MHTRPTEETRGPHHDDAGPAAERARDGLRRRAVAFAAAGSASGGSSHDAERAWHELLAGGWALVDQFEHAGRRYLVARRRRAAPGAHALTPSETACALLAAMGRSQKVIAHELGISASTTSTHVRRAMRKLGLSRPAELVRVLGARPAR